MMKTKAWSLSIAVAGLSLLVWHYCAPTGGSDGGNQNGSNGGYIPAHPKPKTESTSVTPLESASNGADREIVKNAVARVLALVPRLKDATLSESDYIEELKKLAADMSGQDLRDLFALLVSASPPVPKLEQILAGAAEGDPKTVWELVQDNKMDNVSNAASIDVLGAIYANLATLDKAAADAVLEKVGDADVIRRAALAKITARDGVNAVLDILVDEGSPFYSKDVHGSIWAVNNQAKTSGWNALQDLAEQLRDRAAVLGANAVIQPVKAMAEVRPEETMETISKWPASETRSVAGNSAISTIARTHPDLALDLTAKFQGTKQEQINLLLGLQSAYLGINRQDLADDCANLLKENGANP